MSEEDLKKRNAALEERIAKLEKASEPPKPFVRQPMPTIDYTAGASMPRTAIREMVNAVPDALMRDLRADARRPNPTDRGAAPKTEAVQRGSGWRDSAPLTSPLGIEHVDRQIDAQDKIDRAERAMKLAIAGMVKK